MSEINWFAAVPRVTEAVDGDNVLDNASLRPLHQTERPQTAVHVSTCLRLLNGVTYARLRRVESDKN